MTNGQSGPGWAPSPVRDRQWQAEAGSGAEGQAEVRYSEAELGGADMSCRGKVLMAESVGTVVGTAARS